MYGRFVGLDIGTKDIKVSLIKKGFRDVQLLQTIRTETSPSPQGDSDPLAEIFEAYSLPKGDIATSISENPASIRVLNFPFSDSKKIDMVYESSLRISQHLILRKKYTVITLSKMGQEARRWYVYLRKTKSQI